MGISTLKNKLWELCKTYIRLRDKNICQKCGKEVLGRQSHTSHVVPKSHGNILRYDEKNLKVLCYSCHNWWHGSPIEASAWFAKTFPKRYEYLMERKEVIIKFREDDWLDMIKRMKLKIQKLSGD